MNRSQIFSAAAGVAIVLAMSAGLVRADSVWTGEEGHPPIQNAGVKITNVDGDKLAYTLQNGVSKDVPMKNVQQIAVDGETAFNAAEAAFASDKDKALTNYQSALTTSGKDWIKARSALRLIGLAKSKDKFDAEVAAYVQLVKSDPAAAAMGANKPNKPAAGTAGIDAALSSLSNGLGTAGLTAPQKAALLNQQLEIYRAKGDASNVNSTVQKLVELGVSTPADQAMLALAQANVACDGKDYTKAAGLVLQNKTLFTELDQQVDAFYVLARAADGQAGGTADLSAAAKKDPEKMKAVAVAYMRAETFGEKLDDKSHVADCLLRTAEIEAALGDKDAATLLFKQILEDKSMASTPAGVTAKAGLESLKGNAAH